MISRLWRSTLLLTQSLSKSIILWKSHILCINRLIIEDKPILLSFNCLDKRAFFNSLNLISLWCFVATWRLAPWLFGSKCIINKVRPPTVALILLKAFKIVSVILVVSRWASVARRILGPKYLIPGLFIPLLVIQIIFGSFTRWLTVLIIILIWLHFIVRIWFHMV